MSSYFQVSPVRVATALLADLEGDILTISTFYLAKNCFWYPNTTTFNHIDIESEKACKLSLVLRTWHLVVRPEGRFHFRCQKGGQGILNTNSFHFLGQKGGHTRCLVLIICTVISNYFQTTPLHCTHSCYKN